MIAKNVNIAAEMEPAPFVNRRRHKRRSVSLAAGIRGDGMARTLCRVVDISRTGARLQTYSDLKVGDWLTLSLPQLGSYAARVMWADDFSAGVQFEDALEKTLFDTVFPPSPEEDETATPLH